MIVATERMVSQDNLWMKKGKNSVVTYMHPNTTFLENDGRMLHQNKALKNPRYMKK